MTSYVRCHRCQNLIGFEKKMLKSCLYQDPSAVGQTSLATPDILLTVTDECPDIQRCSQYC